MENQTKIVHTVSTIAEECQNVENVKNKSEVKDDNVTKDTCTDGGGEYNSDCSKEESNTSASTTLKRSSPTLDGMTSSGSGASSPTQSVVNPPITGSEIQPNNEQDDDDDDEDETNNAEDDGKASWESGISNLSSSTFITVKLLVSNNMAGSIIGRAGETISELQQQSSSRIKLGQSGDYYPGTSERACLVHGSLENVKQAATLLLQKLYDLQLQQIESQLRRQTQSEDTTDNEDIAANEEPSSSSNVADEEDTHTANISFSVRLLIPSASCGMLIGRNGNNIKKMKETSQVTSIRLASKEPDGNSNMHFSSESMAIAATSERILTISGNELNACISCAFLILDGFARHPDICRYANNTTSYSKITSSFHASFNPNQMGYHMRSPSAGGSMPVMNQHRGGGRQSSYMSAHHTQNPQRMRSSDSFIPGNDGRRNQQQLYQNTHHVSSPLAQVPSRVQPQHMYGTSVPGNSRQRQSATAATTQDIQNQMYTEKMSIPDAMIGAILGKRGNTLNFLQNKSGTKIKISQRGEFVPGTNNRIVTISGPSNQNVSNAKNLIRQQLARNTQDRMGSSAITGDES